MARSFVLVSLLALAASACARHLPNKGRMTDQRYDNLLDVAKKDLRCEDVRYAYLGGSIHALAGCGRQASYLLYCYGPACRWVQNPGEIAVSTMSCDPARIKMTRLNRSTYTFEGCGERQRYRLHGWDWQREDEGAELGALD